MNKNLIAEVVSRTLVAVFFAAIAVWFISLVPAAIDHELAVGDAKVAHHLQMVRGGGE